MEKTKIIILSLCIPIAIMLLAFLFLLLFKITRTNNNKKKIQYVLSFIEKERLKQLEIILQRLSVIARANPIFADTFEKLTYDFDIIQEQFRILDLTISELQLEVSKLNSKKFNVEIETLKVLNETLEEKIFDFKSRANGFLEREEFLRNQMSFYKKKLRMVIETYKKKRVVLDKIAHKIDGLNEQINVLIKRFDKEIEQGKNNNASKIIAEIRIKIILFAQILNECPKMQATIFSIIPLFIKELIKLYKHAEKELKVDLYHIDFKNIILKLSKKFEHLKNLFLNIEFEETKNGIILLIKNIKALEKNINLEIKARNIFVKHYEHTIEIIKVILRKYIELKKEIKELKKSGKSVSVNINDSMCVLKEEVDDLDESASSFVDLFNNKTIPYISRLSRMKIILNKTVSVTNSMNDIYEMIWEEDVVKKVVRNKFTQSEQALILLRAQVSEKGLLLNEEEKKQLKYINETKRELKNLLSIIPFNFKLATEKADLLIKYVSYYYKIVGGKIEMSNMVSNLIKEYSNKRALNNKLNLCFTQAEKIYLAGDYPGSLNMVINGIEEHNKSKGKRK